MCFAHQIIFTYWKHIFCEWKFLRGSYPFYFIVTRPQADQLACHLLLLSRCIVGPVCPLRRPFGPLAHTPSKEMCKTIMGNRQITGIQGGQQKGTKRDTGEHREDRTRGRQANRHTGIQKHSLNSYWNSNRLSHRLFSKYDCCSFFAHNSAPCGHASTKSGGNVHYRSPASWPSLQDLQDLEITWSFVKEDMNNNND